MLVFYSEPRSLLLFALTLPQVPWNRSSVCVLFEEISKDKQKIPHLYSGETQTSLLIVSITTCWQTFNYITDIKQTWLFFLISKTSNLTELPIHWWSCLWSISLLHTVLSKRNILFCLSFYLSPLVVYGGSLTCVQWLPLGRYLPNYSWCSWWYMVSTINISSCHNSVSI